MLERIGISDPAKAAIFNRIKDYNDNIRSSNELYIPIEIINYIILEANSSSV